MSFRDSSIPGTIEEANVEMQVKRFRDQYDWIVLGEHAGALLSASLAAKLGLSVLVLPLGERQGLKISRSGQCFDPESNFLIGIRNLVKSKGLLSECLTRIGMSPMEEQLIRKEGSLTQVVTPGARINFTVSDDDLLAECLRELGQVSAARFGLAEILRESESEILKYWAKLPDRLTWASGKTSQRRRATYAPGEIRELMSSLKKTAGISGESKRTWLSNGTRLAEYCKTPAGYGEFEEFSQGLWYGVVGSPAGSELSLPQLLHILALARTGASFKGGVQAYRDFLVRIARRLGAHIAKAECRRVFVEKGRFVGVQVSQHGSMVAASGGICGCALDEIIDRASIEDRGRDHYIKPSPQAKGWKFSISLTVHSEAIPPGVSSRIVWQEKNAPPLEIEIADPADYGLQERDTKVIHLRTVLPFADETLRSSHQILIATRMLKQVSLIIPFMEYHVTRMYPDFRKAYPALDSRIGAANHESPEFQSAVAELKEAYPFESLKDIPINLRCHTGEGVGSRSGVDGLFVASDEAYPDLGSFGGTVAAIEAVAWLAHRSGIAGPLI